MPRAVLVQVDRLAKGDARGELNERPPGPVVQQPVSRADISHIRGTDSTGVIDTLLARELIADDAGFGGRGRQTFLVTTDRLLQAMGVGSLTELPVRPALR